MRFATWALKRIDTKARKIHSLFEEAKVGAEVCTHHVCGSRRLLELQSS